LNGEVEMRKNDRLSMKVRPEKLVDCNTHCRCQRQTIQHLRDVSCNINTVETIMQLVGDYDVTPSARDEAHTDQWKKSQPR
jgi:hypothetical protein